MQRIKRIALWGLQYGIIAWFSVTLVWYIIVSTLHKGISCDEGYYLMGYLHNQSIGGLGTDFHAIVRALSSTFADNDIMVYRYLRLVLQLFALIFFTGSSFGWLSQKKGLRASRWAYYPMILLGGAMSYTFATPTISYDSLEFIIVLSAAALLFVFFTYKRKAVQSCCAFGIGFLLWFACSNYPPAGVCIVILFTIAFLLETKEKQLSHFLAAFLGVFAALFISHFFIHDMMDWFSEISKVFISTFTEKSQSRHDASSLISGMFLTVVKDILVFIPLVIVFTFLYRTIHLSDRVQWIVISLLCLAMCVVRGVYELRSSLLLVPVALILAKVLASPDFNIKDYLLSKDFFLVIILIAIPIAGVFGTNQPVMKKAIIYAPFWVLAFFFLSVQLKTEQTNRLALLFTVIMFAGYIWLGNFQRYHYYYTPRSSRYEIVGALRPQRVLVSKYQQEYYRDLLDTLNKSGCKPGDRYMAFGENQMSVYLAGGYIDGRLPYHWWQYKVFEKDSPQAFILFKNEEEDVIAHFREAEWGFPEQYKRMEMRQMSQNMGDEYRTVIYYRFSDITQQTTP